ncbi:hypothetical protein [Chitinophaga pinensis]|uniref:Uncharacterized protein n=1 Tax=Chitinophaga pinensis (strain ATCC 43595 / DSM 2588 / LMG 13176 / NBRC 15968 / NCIMB 11800 / UQM 2034) TaxID=485918 RepID=A0A979FYU5_CHIPD|nr:hypothetical protein [Chitinophaga pinensis]ACU57615.1 hypothetical protein Cpin_0112 [Chitinophaga pinensis DSM 2588]
MYELLQIRAQLETIQYKNTGSLFELRLVLMNTGTLLTSRHLANQRGEKDVMTSKLLLLTFRNVRNYYHILETTREAHEQCFKNIKELALQDLVSLFRKLRTSNVVNMSQEQPLMSAVR